MTQTTIVHPIAIVVHKIIIEELALFTIFIIITTFILYLYNLPLQTKASQYLQ